VLFAPTSECSITTSISRDLKNVMTLLFLPIVLCDPNDRSVTKRNMGDTLCCPASVRAIFGNPAATRR